MTEKQQAGIFFECLDRFGRPVSYPAWRYHDFFEPKIVNDTEEDERAELEGWKNFRAPITAVQGFTNFCLDLEDMNCRQLCAYARTEYGADLPIEAAKAKLLWAIWELAKVAKRNQGRMVLLAQSIKMNYDETCKEITRMAGGDIDMCDEITEETLWL